MNLEEMIAFYNEHPPYCLAGFSVNPVTLDGITYDGHGEATNSLFQISCQCGGRAHNLIAESAHQRVEMRGEDLVADNFSVKCTACKKQTPLFDAALHGYDAEVSKIEEPTVSKNESPKRYLYPLVYSCQNCNERAFEIFTRFEYPEDILDDPEFPNNVHDFFSWFTVVVRCTKCLSVSKPVEYECA
jgi:hypothetical protein